MAHKLYLFILASQAKQVFYGQVELNLRWSIVLSTPQQDIAKRVDDDEPIDISIKQHLVIASLPQVELFDVMDNSDQICMRDDCDGNWVENKSYM